MKNILLIVGILISTMLLSSCEKSLAQPPYEYGTYELVYISEFDDVYMWGKEGYLHIDAVSLTVNIAYYNNYYDPPKFFTIDGGNACYRTFIGKPNKFYIKDWNNMPVEVTKYHINSYTIKLVGTTYTGQTVEWMFFKRGIIKDL